MAMGASAGVMRATEALLCSNGGFSVLLRLPGTAVSGADAEQLGLSTPIFQEVPVGPAVWRRMGSDAVLMVAAGSIAELVASNEYGSAESLFENAVGVVVSGVVYGISGAEPLVAAGSPCAYLLTLQAPVWR